MDKMFVSLGNHDSYPNGQWNFAEQEPAQGVRALLHNWVPTHQRLRYDNHGYYFKDIPELKARVISVNSESCDFHNMYQWSELSDPNGLISFLENNFAKAEHMGYKAIVIGHIPDECSHQYQERLRALMERYQKTVSMSMYGHIHSDVFKTVTANDETQDPVGMFTICGSLTTWGGINPSYCVYELDKETLLPVTRKTYSFDIKTANEEGMPEWSLYTDWLSDYAMSDLSPNSYMDLADRIRSDTDLASEYRKRYNRLMTSSTCDEGCMLETYCDQVYFDPYANR